MEIGKSKPKKEKTEYEKISEYYSKISEYRLNYYKPFLQKGQFCDYFSNGEWLVGYIVDKTDFYITVVDLNNFYTLKDSTRYQLPYSEHITYFRKFTRPSLDNLIKERSSKSELAKKITILQKAEYINIFKENAEISAFKAYYFLRGNLYFIFDNAIAKSKDKNTGVEESFKIMTIILEYLSEFYKYINNNFDDFINYRDELSISELADLVLLERKYAIFAFWEEANLLMNKIFLNNESYIDWFFDSEKILQKIMPSSPTFKKITSSKNIICPLYSTQTKNAKVNLEYKSTFGESITLKAICNKTDYEENNIISTLNIKIPRYIIAYLIDYFFALRGYDHLFSLSKNYCNIHISVNILENICLAKEYTRSFSGRYDEEKTVINSNLIKFMEELNESNYNKYSRHIITTFLKKSSEFYPKIQKSSNNLFFEELYLRYVLKLFILNKKENKKIEILNDIRNILMSIEYNELSKEKNNNKNTNNITDIKSKEDSLNKDKDKDKYNKRDKLIKEMNYMTFCSNIKNNKIIEIIFQNQNLTEEIIEIILPILIAMYQNSFGYEFPEKFENEIKTLKKLIFDKLLEKIRIKNISDINNFSKMQKIFCDFCEVFTDVDKYFIYSEIKQIFNNLIYEERSIFEPIFDFLSNFTSTAVKRSNINQKEKPSGKENTFEEKKYYGMELIYEFISEERYSMLGYNNKEKNEMINKTIDYIIKIISSCKNQKEGICIILNKINNSLTNKKDIKQHLILLQKLVNIYTNNNTNILDECLKNNNLFILLINELKDFLSEEKQPKIIDINNIENQYDTDINIDNTDENNLNIKTRIETIFSLMPNYTRNNFDFKNVKEFIKLMVQKDEYSRNICCECLLNSINNFSKDFLFYVNSDIISKTEIFDIRNLKAYLIYKKIIIKINMINNNNFLMYNKDILMLLKEKKDVENEIKGIDNLWNLILNDDQNIDIKVIEDITDLICDIYFGIRIKSEKNIITAYKTFYEDFINNVSQKLNSILISKKNKKNVKAIKSLILLINKIIKKSKNINGETIKNIKELIPQNQNNKTTEETTVEFSFFGKKPLSDQFYFCDVKIKKDECFHILRYTLSSLYNFPVNQISIIVYMNNLGKSELIPKVLEKIIKTSPLKQFNILNDFDNIYQELKGLFNFSQSKKKSSLLIHVKCIENIWEEIYKLDIVNIIYNNSKLPMMFLSLLKGKEESYTFDVLNLIKDNKDLYNKAISDELKEKIKSKKDENLFDMENNNIYYINNIVTNLTELISKNYKEFMKSNMFNNYINKLNIISDDGYSFDEKAMLPELNELNEKYKLCNNLLKIYKSIFENEKDENISILIAFKILNIYNYIINDSIFINLTKCQSSKGAKVTIKDIKNILDETLNNINDIIINDDKFLPIIIKSLTNKDNINNININNNYINKIKDVFIFIAFDSILKNKYSFVNKRIKSLILGLILKFNNNNAMNTFFDFLYEFYLTENTFNKIINILQEIEKNKININNHRYEKNTKCLFDISVQVLLVIYEYIKNKINFEEYISNILSPKIFNYTQYFSQIFPLYSIFPQLIIGGACKLYSTILLLTNINLDSKKYSEFLFNNYLMPNINENILSPQNIFDINKIQGNKSINIYSSFCIKEASNLFITLLFKKSNNTKENNDTYMEYLNILNKYHNLAYWKGNQLSDWKLSYKNSEKRTGYIGLKNLGTTCYINTVLQIFYNIPLLKESLLLCDTPFSGGKNCLYQLKKIFYSLNFLQTNYYTPTSFIENFDNKKLDPKIQMDVFEFLMNFLDKIEARLKNTPNENLIKYFFMGVQNDILAFEEPCEHHRINQSNFYTIQLQVQNKLTLTDSLDAFIEGEKMEGDNCIFCEQCNQKRPGVKSQNFQSLPRILIFVLKRFEFNYNTMKKYKINDYYEFPLELDMDKYVQKDNSNNSNIQKNNNYYKLKGIVIHTGSCESGHYYCYLLDHKTKEWYEFNDTKVSKFDIRNLDSEAFAKNEIIFEDGKKIEKENTRSAYMLLYEKVDMDNGINFDKIQAINEIKKNNKNIIEEKEGFNLIENDELDENKPEINTEYQNLNKMAKEEINDILKPMNEEMYNYFLNKRLFSGEYHHFILSLFINILNSYKISVNNKLSFIYDSCINNNNYVLDKEIKNYRFDRKNPAISNINHYLSRNKIILVNKSETLLNSMGKEDEGKILEMFKYLIMYFFNVMIRAREKAYLGGTVDLIKYFINNYLFCADYIIEEFSNKNVLIEYMINCPSYDIKKLIVGIIYCAMINCVNTYENKMRLEAKQGNKKGEKKTTKKETSNQKKEKVENQQEISDEELARRLQEEENYGYSQDSWTNDSSKNDSNDIEENSNPLERKYIPMNVVKLIYNILHLINIIHFQNMNESRFLYLIIYRFSTISKKCKKFLLNKALVLEFLNILLYESIKQERHNDTKIIKSMNRGNFKPPHSILYTSKKDMSPIYDKGGAFHYENYISELYFYLLSHNQKPKPKRPYFEGSFNFDNPKFIKAIFFRINTRLDAEAFAFLIIQKCKNVKTYKNRIEWILVNIQNILINADYNENINYDINSNKDVFQHNLYNNRDRNTIDYEYEVPKINPKYILLILKKFILNSSENKKIDEFRITQSLSKLFDIVQENQQYYNYMILLIDFIIELFHNNISILHSYIPQFTQNIKSIIYWIRINPISPELYPIKGLLMYKSDNVPYDRNITEQEKKIFDEKNMKNAEIRTNKLSKILDYKSSIINVGQNKYEFDYTYEALFDYSDFRFRKGDFIYYNKKKAIIVESLDELILIKILNEDILNKNKDYDEVGYTLDDIEKIKFWVAKDDKNISVNNLE